MLARESSPVKMMFQNLPQVTCSSMQQTEWKGASSKIIPKTKLSGEAELVTDPPCANYIPFPNSLLQSFLFFF